MCFSSGGQQSPTPPPPIIVPAAAPNKQANKAESDAARATQQKQAALASGQKDTVLTTALGDPTNPNLKKQTLG